jgi:hypothetical protein
MIVVAILVIVYFPPMDQLIVVYVSPMNKKVDPVAETWNRSIKNNVILLLNVEILPVLTQLELVLVNNEPQTNKITQIVTSIVAIVIIV